MSTPTPNTAAASAVASRMMGTEPQPKDEDLPEIEQELEETETEVEAPEEEETTEEESNEETPEEELPANVKEILKKNRKIAREKEAENAELKKRLAELENPDAPKEAPETNDRYKDLYLKTAAKSALATAGFSKATDRFVKMIDFDDLDIDDDGNIDGLEEQVEVLKKEFSDLLTPKTPVRKTVKTDAAGSREPVSTPKSSASKLTEQLKA